MILLLFTFIFVSYLFYSLYWRRRLLPPGPTPLPILGNLLLMKDDMKPGYKLWKKLSQEYGPIYTFWMSNQPMVIITDWKIIKQTIIKDGANYTGRPVFPFNIEIRKGAYGILDASGERWQQQRRFALHVLRNFGMGKNLMEEKIIGELRSLIDRVKTAQSENGKVDMMNLLDAAIGSIINNVLFGYRYDETNMDDFLALKTSLDAHFKASAEPMSGIVVMYPWTAKLPFFRKYKRVIADNFERMLAMFRKQAEEKLKTIDYDNDEYSDYVEAFLKERKKHEHEPNYGGYELEQLDSVCFDLWIAGMETTSNTLYWALLYVMVHDDVRQKVYEELDQKIGNDRIITSSDRSELNYISATINEAQRLANLLPFILSRTADVDVNIGGFDIPKGTTITPQISQVLYDEEIFPEPYKFKPERFLDSEGKFVSVEEFIPFSVGKRQCPGEGLAKLELFIFFANIFNQFDITLDASNPTPSLEKEFGITVKAKNFNVNMKSRF